VNKKVLSILFTFLYLGECFLNFAYANGSDFQGHVEKADTVKEQSDLFTGSLNKLHGKHVLLMTVSKVLDPNVSQKNDEFFAEVTNDLEGSGGIIIPIGTIAHGRIKQVANAKSLGRDGLLDLEFDYLITPDGRETPIKGRMSTRLHPAISTSNIIATDIGYTAAGGAIGGVLALVDLGLRNAIASQGSTVAGGAAIGSAIGLGVSLYRKGRNVLISPGDDIRVEMNTSTALPVYKKTAFLQHELYQDGLNVKIKDITYGKNPFGDVDIITLSLEISNMTNLTFSIYDLALINDYNTLFYPAVFGDAAGSIFKELKPGEKFSGEIPFSVDGIKRKFWLTFYDRKSNKALAKISINNAYRKISNKSKKQNKKLFKRKSDFYIQ